MNLFKKYKIQIFYFIIITIIIFVNNNNISLWDQDEAAYAGFAKNMLESNDWLVPDFMWSDIHRKPPLHFWNIAICYKMFGINEFSVRFPSAIFIILTYLVVYLWGRRLFGEKTAFLSTVILSTSFFVPSLAKISVTDATLLFFSTVCGFAILQIIQKKSASVIIIFWTAFSLALLTKGPPIIIFCFGLVAILTLFHKNRKNLISLHPWFFLPIALIPLFLWGYLTTLTDGGSFINWMIDWYVLKRVGGSVLGQTGPPGTHLLFLVVFFIPYLMFFPKAFWNGIRGIVKRDEDNLLLGAWFVAGWLIYEFSPSKLPAYTIVAHVPLAILIGKTIFMHLESKTRPDKFMIILHFIIFILFNIGLFIAPFYLDLPSNIKWTLGITSSIVLTGILVSFRFYSNKHFITAIFGVALLFQFMIWVFVLPQIDTLKNSSKRVSNYIENNAVESSSVLISHNIGHPPSLPYYLSLHFKPVSGEQNIDLLLSKYQSNQPYVFVLTKEHMEQFLSTYPDLDFQEISSFFTDRKGKTNYCILLNDKSKKLPITKN